MSAVAPVPGDVIEDYEILEKVGGNMGMVFKARHRQLDKVVALKLLPPESIADPARLARFQREMRVMGRLEHPNLVTATDARSVDSGHLVVMQWIDGVDLHRLVRDQGPLPVAAACEAARQAALGLQYAHQHGLIHRDIKPSNLMLTRSGTMKVIDMGLALTREDTAAQLTHTGFVLGTMAYCAPEQFRDASKVDIRADIYSLGCTLYHLLAGKAPYWERKTFPELVQAHLNEPFPKLTEARPDAPAGLEAVLARMTAKDPEARFATPAEVAQALEPFAESADLKPFVPPKSDQSPAGRFTPGKTPRPPQRRQTEEGAEQRPKVRWSRRAALFVLLPAIPGAAFLFMNCRKRDTAVPSRAPVTFLMDTTALRGIYDLDNIEKGRSNADELYTVLAGLDGILLQQNMHREGIGLNWGRDSFVAGQHPDIVIIHRSSFFHPLAAFLKLEYPPFTDDAGGEKLKKWQAIYDAQDARLRSFLRTVGAVEPQTQFLIYSTGTDKRWLKPEFRANWTETLESELPTFKGRINTMVIPPQSNGDKGTFRDPATMEKLRGQVSEMLKKWEKVKTEKAK